MIRNNIDGYRFKTFELKNFGGYHLIPTVFDFNGEGAVFSGANGAGKSTAIDAARLLFVRNPRFNSASADKKDAARSVESYYLGTYANRRCSKTGRNIAVNLRSAGDENTFMGVLAVFQNGRGDVFTVGRLLFLRANGNSTWHNFSAPRELSLAEHFSTWETNKPLARKLQDLSGVLHNTAEEYFAALAEYLGYTDFNTAMSSFRSFEDSIGAKNMESVDGFAAQYLLPTCNFATVAENAITQLEASNTALVQIKMVNAQIKHLEDMEKRRQTYLKSKADAEIFNDRSVLSDIARDISRRGIKRVEHAAASAELRGVLAQQAELEIKIANNTSQIETVREALNSDDARRRRELHREKATVLTQIATRAKTVASMIDTAASVSVQINANSEEQWSNAQVQINAKLEAATTAGDKLRDEKSALDNICNQKKQEVQSAQAEIELLKTSGSNLPSGLQTARAAIAEELGLANDDLPFLCELVRIKPGEEEWEGVANRVLEGAAKYILVDENNYNDAVRVLNGRVWKGTRVSLTKVSRLSHVTMPDRGSLADKLEVKQHRYADYVSNTIANTANHQCVSDAAIGTAQGRAVTSKGTIREPNRAVKDDRSNIADSRNFLLAWDTTARRKALEAELQVLITEFTKLANEAQQYNAGIQHHAKTAQTCNRLLGGQGWPDYAEIAVGHLQDRLASIDVELAALQNTETEVLEKKLSDLQELARRLEAQRKMATIEQGKLDQLISTAEKDLDKAREAIKTAWAQQEAKGSVVAFTREHRLYYRELMVLHAKGRVKAAKTAFAEFSQFDISETDAIWRDIKQAVMECAATAGKAIISSCAAVQRQADLYLSTWPQDAHELESGITDGNGEIKMQIYADWLKIFERKKRDDLASTEERLRSEIDDAVVKHIYAFEAEINQYDEAVKNMMTSINALLEQVIYDPALQSRAQMRFDDSKDDAIRLFKSRFIAIAKITHSAPIEEIMDKLRDLLKDLHDTGETHNTRMRTKILRLANWKEVYVVEQTKNTETGEYEDFRVFSGKDGASGGQQERLTMLMIGSAQSYGMGGADPTRTPFGLQTIILDEAFLRSSSETAEASTDILSAMGLQVIAATPADKLRAFHNQTNKIFNITSSRNRVQANIIRHEEAFKKEAYEIEMEGLQADFSNVEVIDPTAAERVAELIAYQ